MEKQVISKQRVADHGEVLTNQREVNAMLDLVKTETERIESRFLEPACGTGNFLAEVLQRKLAVVESRYRKSQLEYERYAVLAVGSIYGIELLADNVQTCRERLYRIFNQCYTGLYRENIQPDCQKVVGFILAKNIIHGDALTLQTVGEHPGPIIFSEWSEVNGGMLKRRDFSFDGLMTYASAREMPLFSDLEEEVYIPAPVKEFPLCHFLRVADAEQ